MPQASGVIRIVRCNGCRRLKDEVTYMIAGPNVYMCDRCVAQAKTIVPLLLALMEGSTA